jgi:hypothetical protein
VSEAMVVVRAVRHAFSEDYVECALEPGKTLREIIGEKCGDGLVLTVDGEPIPASEWRALRPAAGAIVTACPIPHGDNAKTIVLTLGLIAAAYFSGGALAAAFVNAGSTSSFLTSATLWTGATYAVGSLDLNALVRR